MDNQQIKNLKSVWLILRKIKKYLSINWISVGIRQMINAYIKIKIKTKTIFNIQTIILITLHQIFPNFKINKIMEINLIFKLFNKNQILYFMLRNLINIRTKRKSSKLKKTNKFQKSTNTKMPKNKVIKKQLKKVCTVVIYQIGL